MTVQEVVDFARSSELSKISDNALPEKAVISYINLGLIELYKRFTLETKEQIIDLQENVTTYTLNSEAMNIVEITNELGHRYIINDEQDTSSIHTPSWNKLQVPNPSDGATIFVLYVSSPSLVASLSDIIPLPLSLLEALLHYIGYRANAAKDGSIQAENNTHYTRFEVSCRRVKQLGLVTEDDLRDKITVQERGYV